MWESSILFSFETDFTGRVKAGPQIETWQGLSAAAFTPAVRCAGGAPAHALPMAPQNSVDYDNDSSVTQIFAADLLRTHEVHR